MDIVYKEIDKGIEEQIAAIWGQFAGKPIYGFYAVKVLSARFWRSREFRLQSR